jgi:hypothetical protein
MFKILTSVNSYVLNTIKTFFLLFDYILPIFESFQISPKILIFLKKSYFFQKVNNTSFREFHELLKSNSRKKNFKPF